MRKYVYIWYNNNKGTYYMKLLNHENFDYYVGYTNQYNHTIVLIDKISFDFNRSSSIRYYKVKTIRSIIAFLEKIL